MSGKKMTMWAGGVMGVLAAGAVLFTFNDQPSQSLFRQGSTSQARLATADANLAAAQVEAEAQTKADEKADPDKTDASDTTSPTTADTASGKTQPSKASADADDSTKDDDADADSDDADADSDSSAMTSSGKSSSNASTKKARSDASSDPTDTSDLIDPIDDDTSLDDPLTSGSSLDDENPVLTSEGRPFVIAGEDGPKMPTDHSHWLKGSIFNARVTVALNGVKLGDFQASQDKDITWKLKKGLNTVSFTYTPLVKSASAHLDILESEHDPPVPPLVSFRSTALTGLPSYGHAERKVGEPVTRTFAFIAH